MASLGGVLANIPGLGGYLAAQQNDQQQQLGQLQQIGGLQGILSQVQQQQQRQQAMQEQQQLQQTVAGAAGPEDAIKRLLATGNPRAIEVAAKLKGLVAKPDAGQQIGSGGLRLPGGTIIPPAARPETTKSEKWSAPYNMNGVVVQRNMDTGQIRTAVTREPQVRVTNEAPVTPVTIQDPNNPRETIIIDGRTRRVLGKGPKMTEAGKIDTKADLQMGGLSTDLQAAEDLLTGVKRTSDGQAVRGNLPTGSGVGSLYDKAAGFIGMSPSGAEEAKELKTVAARLVGRVPRFEGPQSDKDVALYKEAAADAGNENVPRGQRLKAIKRMRSIYAGYESGERGRITGGRRGGDGAPETIKVDW